MKLAAATLFLIVSFAILNTAAGIGRTAYAYYYGGIPGCTQCGVAGQYACSNGVIGYWNDGRTNFTDPLNATEATQFRITNIRARVYGNFGCDISKGKTVDIKVYVAQHLMQIIRLQSDSAQCACGRCNYVDFNLQSLGGVQGYRLNDTNSIQVLAYDNFICVNRIELYLTYVPIPPKNFVYDTINNFRTPGGEACAYCGDFGQYTCSTDGKWPDLRTLAVLFKDPLPFGSLLFHVNATVFGAFFCDKYIGSNYVYGYLQDTQISNYYTQSSGACACNITCASTPVQLNAVNSYPSGWPLYKYAGENMLRIVLGTDTSKACISRIELQFYAYIRNAVTGKSEYGVVSQSVPLGNK